MTTGQLAVGDHIVCLAFPGCAMAQITSIQGTPDSGDAATLIVDRSNTLSGTTNPIATVRHPGAINNLTHTNNRMDCYGADLAMQFDETTFQPLSFVATVSGNKNLQSGSAVTLASCPIN